MADKLIDGAGDPDPLHPEPMHAGHEEASTPLEEPPPHGTSRNPWAFVPLLYFLQGLPVIAVQQVSATLFTKMGVEVAAVTQWSNILKLPWTFKPLYAALIDLNWTKRKWVVLMQALIFIALLASAFVMTSPSWFTLIIITFLAVGILSTTHDIAADGFYLLALKEKDQAFFVGIRSAAFRLATVFCTGGLVYIAGTVEESTKDIPRSWMVALGFGAAIYGVGALINAFAMPKPRIDVDLRNDPVENKLNLLRTAAFTIWAIFGFYFLASAIRLIGHGIYAAFPDGIELFGHLFGTSGWHLAGIERQFPDEVYQVPIRLVVAGLGFYVTTGLVKRLLRGTEMGHALTSYFAQNKMIAILSFIMFYRFGESMISSISSPFFLGERGDGALGLHTKTQGFIWGTVGVTSLIIGGLLGGILISKWGIKRCFWPMVLALNVPNLAYVWIAFNMPASPVDQIIRNAPDMAMFTPEWFSHMGGLFAALPQDYISMITAIDQMGYGFGFAAYLVYLMFISQGTERFQTSHYAISTGLMAIGALLPGAISGSIAQAFGYQAFFVIVCILTIPGMLTLFFIPMNKQDLRVRFVEDV